VNSRTIFSKVVVDERITPQARDFPCKANA